ncbi:MAG: hypothetical protein H0T47_03580 [Planctomycetaceae bacterium]|nr:hypothetical protein [Planctomycetaceae bacterium]
MQPVSQVPHSVGTAQLGAALQHSGATGAQQLGAAGAQPHGAAGAQQLGADGAQQVGVTSHATVAAGAQHVGAAFTQSQGAAQLGAAGVHSQGAAQLGGWQSEPCEHKPAAAGPAVNAADKVRAAANVQRRIVSSSLVMGFDRARRHRRLRRASWG